MVKSSDPPWKFCIYSTSPTSWNTVFTLKQLHCELASASTHYHNFTSLISHMGVAAVPLASCCRDSLRSKLTGFDFIRICMSSLSYHSPTLHALVDTIFHCGGPHTDGFPSEETHSAATREQATYGKRQQIPADCHKTSGVLHRPGMCMSDDRQVKADTDVTALQRA